MKIDLRLGDALELIRTIPDESIDAIITDPPYGISYLSHRTKNHSIIQNDGEDAFMQLMVKFLPEAKRVLTKTGVLCMFSAGGTKTTTPLLTMEIMKQMRIVSTLVWSKGRTDGSFMGLGWRYRPSFENIIVASKDPMNYNFYVKGTSNVFVCRPHIPQKGEHPTQKPEAIIRWLVKNHTQEGHTILDPFMGSGTTGVVSHRMNRNFIGFEIDQQYFGMARERIETTPADITMEMMEEDE